MSTGPTVSVATAAQLTGLSKKAIRRRIERGTLKSTLLEGHHHIPITELQRSGLLNERPPIGAEDQLGASGAAEGAGARWTGLLDSGSAAVGEEPPSTVRGDTPAVLAALDARERGESRQAGRNDRLDELSAVRERLQAVERRLSAQAEMHDRLESTVAQVEVKLVDVQTHQRSLAAHLHQVQAWFRQLSTQRKSRFLRRHGG